MSDAQKHILVVSYSQTGQLDALASHFLHPLKQQENTVIEEYKIRPLGNLFRFLINFRNRYT